MMPETFTQPPTNHPSPPQNQAQDQGKDHVKGRTPPSTNPVEPEALPAVDATFEGKTVFSPNELNQSGEDKEYFHPDKGRKFDAPKDANANALTPDVEVTPDNSVKRIG
ncbi:hypothetical protein AEAC466_07825 [Asticcacaulis sp. AC466]|uniref:hypothetical protein n=1 Tax=Asticcacaulis sp. AC466 TaxID=1282362 RepID=UPI0003C3F1DA|nr:hypothetical protein [Asticcacaulis sp. AC466]ESQ84956.1 hypothetical protein AEAC466_07825 [Asticcacaulis sp. AC466]